MATTQFNLLTGEVNPSAQPQNSRHLFEYRRNADGGNFAQRPPTPLLRFQLTGRSVWPSTSLTSDALIQPQNNQHLCIYVLANFWNNVYTGN